MRERLDLQALDKEGRLAVVENKLDDSGRDVVWQALKYVAYCSSLKKAEIVGIYQNYLDRWSDGADAVANLCDFLDAEELDDVVLNAGHEQRLVSIAAKVRKEVTARVLWLLGHGVHAQCFRVVPYSFGEELFIDLQQTIPTPEAANYMIEMAGKDSETQSIEGARKRSKGVRHACWTKALEELRARNVSRFERCGCGLSPAQLPQHLPDMGGPAHHAPGAFGAPGNPQPQSHASTSKPEGMPARKSTLASNPASLTLGHGEPPAFGPPSNEPEKEAL